MHSRSAAPPQWSQTTPPPAPWMSGENGSARAQIQQAQLQQAMMSMQLHNMQLHASLEAKRATRLRLEEKQAASAGSNHAELLQQVATQSLQLQALMVQQMVDTGGGAGVLATEVGRDSGGGVPHGIPARLPQSASLRTHRELLPQPQPQPQPQQAGRPAVDPSRTEPISSNSMNALGKGPREGMREIKPDELDLDLLVPTEDPAASLDFDSDPLAELGIHGHGGVKRDPEGEESVEGKRRRIFHPMRVAFAAICFTQRCWADFARKKQGGFSTDDATQLVNKMTTVCSR
jgi:hypothetical protein